MGGHHKENFISKYIFSLDHKMIAKQFLITGMFMAIVGMLMSAIFRVQLANPGETSFLYNLLPSGWINAETGALEPDKYLALVTMHGTILVFWVLTAGLSGTFANFLIPVTNRSKRYGFWFYEYVIILVLFCCYCCFGMVCILRRSCNCCRRGSGLRRMDHLSSVKCSKRCNTRIWIWYDFCG